MRPFRKPEPTPRARRIAAMIPPEGVPEGDPITETEGFSEAVRSGLIVDRSPGWGVGHYVTA